MWVDILITTYKRKDDLLDLLDNLRKQTYRNFSVKIFDGTPDNSIEHAVGQFNDHNEQDYELVYLKTPTGMTRQRNIAVDQTKGEISIFLDDDVILQDDYLAKVVEVFSNDNEQQIAGLNGYDLVAATSLGKRKRIYRALGLLPKVGNARYLSWGHGTPLWEGGQFSGIRDCDILIGHNMAWRTSVLKRFRFNEFYEKYPTYVLYDDQEICLRVRNSDLRLVQCGDAKVMHNIASSGRPPGEHYGFQAIFNAYWNWKKFIQRRSLLTKIKFWSWELLDFGFQIMNPKTRAVSLGRLQGFQAIVGGYSDYDEWINRKSEKVFSREQGSN